MGKRFGKSGARVVEAVRTQEVQPHDLTSLTRLITRTVDDRHGSIIVRSPATGEEIGSVPACTKDDVQLALKRARKAQKKWMELPIAQRRNIILRYHAIVLERQAELLDVLQIEAGKARRDALEEVLDVAINCRHYAYRAESYLEPKWRKGVLPLLTTTWEFRHPVGVVGFISPWNYPLTLTISDAIPALLAGNAVILKPDSQTPFAALLGVQWLLEAGLPDGLFQIVTGYGKTIGAPLIGGVDYICFTGSTETGREIARQAGENLIRCSLELGGKNPMVVLDDADLGKAVQGAIRGCFANAGQLCLSFERVYLQDGIHESFLHAFIEAASNLRLGRGKDFEAEMGSLISAQQLRKVDDHIQDAVGKGAKILTGGRARPDLGPLFYEPTILAEVTADMKVAQEETFGPVVSIYRFKEIEQAIAMANDSLYGLNASIWTDNVGSGREIAKRLKCGTVNINEAYAAAWGSVDAPMGGMKASGIGRRHGEEGFLKFTQAQTVSSQRFVSVGPWPGVKTELYARIMTAALRLLRHIPGLR